MHQAWEWDEQPQHFLIFDRDAKFGGDVVSTVKGMGSQPIRTALHGVVLEVSESFGIMRAM